MARNKTHKISLKNNNIGDHKSFSNNDFINEYSEELRPNSLLENSDDKEIHDLITSTRNKLGKDFFLKQNRFSVKIRKNKNH